MPQVLHLIERRRTHCCRSSLLAAALKAAFPTNPILTAVTWIGAAMPSPGVRPLHPLLNFSLRLTLLLSRFQLIVNNNLPSPCMQFGPFYAEGKKDEGELESSNQLQSLFSAVDGIEAEVVEDMQTARWTKVIWVSLAVL